VVELAKTLRTSGFAVDFRGPTQLGVLAKMGLLDQLRRDEIAVAIGLWGRWLKVLLVDQPVGGLAAIPVTGLFLLRLGSNLRSEITTPQVHLKSRMTDRLLTIGELARRTGVAASALRYWEELGLLATPTRVSGQRRYPNMQ
jgi:hypothetical protein